MGKRSRGDDVADHVKQSKGAPTPKAPQNQAPAAPAPACVHTMFAMAFRAGLSQHPSVADTVLDLAFQIPGGVATIRIPVNAWDAIKGEVDALIEQLPEQQAAQRAAKAGIHLPAGVDIKAEADGFRKIKEGPTAS